MNVRTTLTIIKDKKDNNFCHCDNLRYCSFYGGTITCQTCGKALHIKEGTLRLWESNE